MSTCAKACLFFMVGFQIKSCGLVVPIVPSIRPAAKIRDDNIKASKSIHRASLTANVAKRKSGDNAKIERFQSSNRADQQPLICVHFQSVCDSELTAL